VTFKITSQSKTAVAASWQPLPVGAGGFVRDIDIANDGTIISRNDTYGSHLWVPGVVEPGPGSNTGVWKQIVTPNSIPSGHTVTTLEQRSAFQSNMGSYSLGIAPSNSNVLYMGYLGYMFVSTNKGSAWSAMTGWTAVTVTDMPSNDQSSPNWFGQCGPKVSVDPIDPSIAFFCTQTGGLFKTLDGMSVSAVTGMGATTTGGVWTAYDRRASTQSGGVSQVIYGFRYGIGAYKSTDGGSTWTKISGSGTSNTALLTCRRMVVDVNGTLWLTDDTNTAKNVWKYAGTTWTNITSMNNNGATYHSIAIDPTVANAQRIILGDLDGVLSQSPDGGTTWTGSFNGPVGFDNLVATDIPYLALDTTNLPLNGNQIFDSSGLLHWASGVGVWNASVPTDFSSAWAYTSQSAGIEQLVSNMITSPPGGVPIAVCWDRATIQIADVTKYASTYQPPIFTGPPGASSVDWASSSPSHIFVVREGGIMDVSSNGGSTWGTRSGLPQVSQGGGSIAASTSADLLYAQVGGDLYYSTDGGTTWNSLGSYFQTNFGIPAGGDGWCGFANYQNIQNICADRVDATTFYAYNNNIASQGGGVYKTVNGGVAWALTMANDAAGGLPSGGNQGGNSMLLSVPGKSGHLISTGGQGYVSPHPQAYKTFISTNHGVSFSDLNPLLREVWCVGVGKQIGSYPRIAAWGWYNGVPGVWQSDDGGSTWIKIGEQTTYGSFDTPKWLAVDNNNGQVYIGFTGSGFARYG
jgi:hypothetical protein